MAITIEGVRDRFPEFTETAVSDDSIQRAISTAYCMFDETKCGSCGEEIAYWLIAHLIHIWVIDDKKGEVKGIASESLGEASHSFSEVKNSIPIDSFYSTRYGQTYQQLLKTNCPKIGTIIAV